MSSICSVIFVRLRLCSVRGSRLPSYFAVTNNVEYPLQVGKSRPSYAHWSLQPACVMSVQRACILIGVEDLIPGPRTSAEDQQTAQLYVVVPAMLVEH